MKTSQRTTIIAILFTLLVIFSACQPGAVVEPTPTVGMSIAAEDTPTTPPADTPIPPTETPVPQGVPMNPVAQEITLDPANALDADSQLVCAYIYQTLIVQDAIGNPAKGLAVSWLISDDRLDYILTLRPNVTFSDGTPFNADAVLANFNRWFDPASPLRFGRDYTAWKTNFLGFKGEKNADDTPKSFFDGIEKVDNLTVLIHLNRQQDDLLTLLANPAFAMVNPAAVSRDGNKFGTAVSVHGGTGAYMLQNWTAASLVLAPNPVYWGETAPEPLEFPFK